MKEKIKNYMNKPLTRGWLWKTSIISFILTTLFCIGYYKIDIKQIIHPSDDWEDVDD